MKKLFTLIFMVLLINTGTIAVFAAGENEGASVSFTSPTFTLVDDTVVNNTVYDPELGRLISGNEDLIKNPYPLLGNANKTGSNPMVKAVPGQNVHGEYQNNTNSCASCHQTHTAAAKDLLFRSNLYFTCTSCHDGTLGFYNVLAPGQYIWDNLLDPDSNGVVEDVYLAEGGAGTFAGTIGTNPSMHLATGALQNNMAPGGNRTNTNQDTSAGSTWGAVFDCASCHSPHGSYSPRLLHYNPNNAGNELPEKGGYKEVNLDVYSENVDGTLRYYVGGGNNNFTNRNKNPWLYGYYSYSPKVYWTSFAVYKAGDTIIEPPAGKDWNDIFQIYYGSAYFTINPADYGAYLSDLSYIKADIAPAIIVNMATTPYDLNRARKVIDYGDAGTLNRFCAACHTDYNSLEGASEASGTFSEAHRHSMTVAIEPGMLGSNNERITCLTCHYGHGTTGEIQLWADNSYPVDPDINNSTALKRYINMSVCIKCHQFNHNQ